MVSVPFFQAPWQPLSLTLSTGSSNRTAGVGEQELLAFAAGVLKDEFGVAPWCVQSSLRVGDFCKKCSDISLLYYIAKI